MEAGVDGALPGIVMPAAPEVGDTYRQEFDRGEAEDLAEVVRLAATETVPFGHVRRPPGHPRSGTRSTRTRSRRRSLRPGSASVLEAVDPRGEGRVELVEFVPAP